MAKNVSHEHAEDCELESLESVDDETLQNVVFDGKGGESLDKWLEEFKPSQLSRYM